MPCAGFLHALPGICITGGGSRAFLYAVVACIAQAATGFTCPGTVQRLVLCASAGRPAMLGCLLLPKTCQSILTYHPIAGLSQPGTR